MLNKTQPDLESGAALWDKPQIRVLVIEDDNVECLAIQRSLDRYPKTNFKVTTVSRFEQGMALMKTDFFEVVVLDLSLPDSHGGETILRAHLQALKVPLIIWTGYRDRQLTEMARNMGAQAYLIKGMTSMERLGWEIHQAVREKCLTMASEIDLEPDSG